MSGLQESPSITNRRRVNAHSPFQFPVGQPLTASQSQGSDDRSDRLTKLLGLMETSFSVTSKLVQTQSELQRRVSDVQQSTEQSLPSYAQPRRQSTFMSVPKAAGAGKRFRSNSVAIGGLDPSQLAQLAQMARANMEHSDTDTDPRTPVKTSGAMNRRQSVIHVGSPQPRRSITGQNHLQLRRKSHHARAVSNFGLEYLTAKLETVISATQQFWSANEKLSRDVSALVELVKQHQEYLAEDCSQQESGVGLSTQESTGLRLDINGSAASPLPTQDDSPSRAASILTPDTNSQGESIHEQLQKLMDVQQQLERKLSAHNGQNLRRRRRDTSRKGTKKGKRVSAVRKTRDAPSFMRPRANAPAPAIAAKPPPPRGTAQRGGRTVRHRQQGKRARSALVIPSGPPAPEVANVGVEESDGAASAMDGMAAVPEEEEDKPADAAGDFGVSDDDDDDSSSDSTAASGESEVWNTNDP